MIAWWLILAAFIIALILYYIDQRTYDGINKIPGPFSFPLIGNAFSIGFNKIDNFRYVYENQKKFGSIVRYWMMWLPPVISIDDADAVATILSSMKYIDKSPEYKYLEPWLGTGLLTSTGTKWQKRRKLITPAFHFKILEEFIDIFTSETDLLINKLSTDIEEEKSFNIYPVLNLCSLDIICRSAMGTSIHAQTSETDYVKSVKRFLHLQYDKKYSVWKNIDFFYKFTKAYAEEQAALRKLHYFTDSVIKLRREQLAKSSNEVNQEFVDEFGKKRKIAFLDLLMQSTIDGQPLSDEDIREEVDTFMFEGHDTISSALSFTLYELSQHTDIQEKIYQEIKTIFPNSNEPIKHSHLQELNYLGMVIKKSMRLHPPVPLYERELQEEVQLGKYKIPKKATVLINAFSIQRNDKYFCDAKNFNPDRFSGLDNDTNYHPYCYVPFSGGPRNCIGQRFAMLEMKMIIAKILLNFHLLPDDQGRKLILFDDSVLNSSTGFNLQIKKR